MAFRQLEYLVAVAQERHFARAAEKCYVSQPALSAAIAKLEREFDAALISRGRAYEGLTPQGERLVGWARRMLAEYGALKAEMRATGTDITGTLRLGVVPIATTVTSTMVSGFCTEYPSVNVEVRSALTTVELYRRLRQYEIDAAIVSDDDTDDRDLELLQLCADRYVLVSAGDMLSAGASVARWPDAARLPLALLTTDTRPRSAIDEAFAKHGIIVTPRIEADSVASLLGQVGTGEWASIIPRSWLPASLERNDIRAIPLVDPTLDINCVLATNRAGPASPLARAFLAYARPRRLRSADRGQRPAPLRGIPLAGNSFGNAALRIPG
ncbi:LysR family transcriptional regulator [Mycobacterium sherrisii]|uniref:Probable hydrogen peroxide-inducible genes activator n=1 Tax=Mycobacterium sherrisii TaxID=243061 RepID=A0A1E3T5T4_9MYCO|nr:LysR family transcriptional regulator [Mycobacterium sherrisii]MCV7029692.1 LysR family transcriptional regulator [Mycobacterium sherrisii]MEC4762313.1 LysR family transcriptional regulator [Mycobacterium sherrisii]ODR09681.1 LysR family transcriptional regulator [Mycobacterium sherrisii]